MINIGSTFPDFHLKAVTGNDLHTAFSTISNKDYPNQWLVVFFWPKDFTFVCPTEIVEFGKMYKAFQEQGAQVLGVSVDSEFVHLAWRESHPGLRTLPFPMLSDIKRELSESLGILNETEGVSERATFIVDPNGKIRFSMVTDLNVGRNPSEVLRVLLALKTDGLTGCNWQPGEKNIDV